MSKIEILSNEIISRVAAGEVIEFPAAVVKELVENSIDAHATQIDIEIEDLGLAKIRVADNGEGMQLDDLNKCYLRHATSKIKDFEDLKKISTLGFRGEALYAIAAISRMNIKTKTKASLAGYELELDGSTTSKVKPLGMADGTIVTVKNLFHNIPARRAFYENKIAEVRKLVKTVGEEALVNHMIGFKLTINKKLTLLLPKGQNLEERINYLLGTNLNQTHLFFDETLEDISIKGHVSKPQFTTASRDIQYLFINSRPVKDNEIANTIKRSFSTLIDVHAHPTFVLYIETPKELVDVNVHPRKREVLLINKDKVLQNIQTTLKKLLMLSDVTYEVNSERDANTYMASTLKDKGNVWNLKTNTTTEKYDEILQINKLYLVYDAPDGMTVIDQHAAHERILYEEFLEKLNEERDKNKTIEISEIIEIPANLTNVLEDQKEILASLGFALDVFRNNSYQITQVPEMFKTYDLKKLVLEILEDLEENQNVTHDTKTLKTISYLACRSAIKGGDYLTYEERKNLLQKLDQTKTKYTCPHGRPVKLTIGKNELAKMFKRIK